MNKSLSKVQKVKYTIFFVFFTYLILTHSTTSLYYAFTGLNLWFTKMIPALFPFMILSGIMVRLQLTEGFSMVLYPIINPLFHIRKNVCYVIIMGFLCGFPMGAKVTYDLLKRDMITQREAEYLLAFCNNIGPVYFCSFVLPLLGRKLTLPYLVGMYGLPLLYGIALRYTKFKDLSIQSVVVGQKNDLTCCSEEQHRLSLLEQIDDSIISAIESILLLGGYMVLFNLCNLIPHVIFENIQNIFSNISFNITTQLPVIIAPFLEITGGLNLLGDRFPFITLIMLPFGGLSCIAQTYSIIRNTDLSIYSYILHKLILTGITILFYLIWHWIAPSTYLL